MGSSALLLLFNTSATPAPPPSYLLDLDFTTGSLPGGTTFTAAATGNYRSYFDNAGVLQFVGADVPRFDYNPATLAPLGILIEPSATNLVYPSLPQTSWGPYGSSYDTLTANAGTAPDGTTTALKLTEGNGNSQHIINSPDIISFQSGQTYIASMFMKAGTNYITSLNFAGSVTTKYAVYDLNSGSVVGGTYISAGIINCGNGWYFVWFTFNSAATISSHITIASAGNNPSYVRGGTFIGSGNTTYFADANVVNASSVTSDIPTTTAPATRAADDLSFTIPSGVSQLTYTFDDNSTQNVSVSPGVYHVPTNLNRRWIKRIRSDV